MPRLVEKSEYYWPFREEAVGQFGFEMTVEVLHQPGQGGAGIGAHVRGGTPEVTTLHQRDTGGEQRRGDIGSLDILGDHGDVMGAGEFDDFLYDLRARGNVGPLHEDFIELDEVGREVDHAIHGIRAAGDIIEGHAEAFTAIVIA